MSLFLSPVTVSCILLVSATAFHKEQPVLDFIADVLCNASSQESKKDGGSRGGYNSSGEDGRSSTPPTNLSDTQIKLLTKFIKGRIEN